MYHYRIIKKIIGTRGHVTRIENWNISFNTPNGIEGYMNALWATSKPREHYTAIKQVG